MTLSTIDEGLKRPRAVSATVSATSLRVTLEDGAGIDWNQLDDSLSVPRLLGLPEFD
jgi:hypothetical protein